MATNDRRSQPKCVECHHPKSFHGGGLTDCRALGCDCLRWFDPSRKRPAAKKPLAATA